MCRWYYIIMVYFFFFFFFTFSNDAGILFNAAGVKAKERDSKIDANFSIQLITLLYFLYFFFFCKENCCIKLENKKKKTFSDLWLTPPDWIKAKPVFTVKWFSASSIAKWDIYFSSTKGRTTSLHCHWSWPSLNTMNVLNYFDEFQRWRPLMWHKWCLMIDTGSCWTTSKFGATSEHASFLDSFNRF